MDRQGGHAWRSKRGLGYSVCTARSRPSNTTFMLKELMGNEAYTEAILSSLKTQTWGISRQGPRPGKG